MFCTECGQTMADEAKFCAFCGTRRVVASGSGSEAQAPAAPPRVEAPILTAPPAPVRTIRSTAEIMQMRARPAAPRPPIEEPRVVEPEPVPNADWPEEESAAPPMYVEPEPPPPSRVRESVPPPSYTGVPAAPRYGSVPFAAEPGSADVVGARRKTSPVLIGAIIVALIALAGIFWMVRSSMSIGGKSSAPVAITIFPTSAKTVVGKGVDFVAEVTGAPTSDVTWSVEEGDSAGEIKTRGASAKEDTISLYCTYTAPQKPGTYHLVATSTADKSKSAIAEITVAAK
jgi:Immunoglobulin I-set domain/zinc-ribbon domain